MLSSVPTNPGVFLTRNLSTVERLVDLALILLDFLLVILLSFLKFA